MELVDIIPAETWRSLAEDMYQKFGFNSCIYNRDNMIIHPPVGWANELCPIIKAGDSRIICATSQQNIAKKASESRRFVIDECEIGFSKFLVPIFLNGEFLGSAGGCGCVLSDHVLDVFYISKVLKKDEAEIQRFVDTVPRISREKIAEALAYLEERIQDIMQRKS